MQPPRPSSPRAPLRTAALAVAALLAAGCVGRAIVKGALTEDERREHVEQTGALIPVRLQQPFIKGLADTGMSREMIVYLYGQPDRTENERYGVTWSSRPDSVPPLADMRDSIWIYYGADSSTVKRGVVFRGDTVVRVSGDIAK
jgi:hypothetical protein